MTNVIRTDIRVSSSNPPVALGNLPFQANKAERETESEALVYKSSHARQLSLIRSRPLTPLRSFFVFSQTFICLLEIVRTYFAQRYTSFFFTTSTRHSSQDTARSVDLVTAEPVSTVVSQDLPVCARRIISL